MPAGQITLIIDVIEFSYPQETIIDFLPGIIERAFNNDISIFNAEIQRVTEYALLQSNGAIDINLIPPLYENIYKEVSNYLELVTGDRLRFLLQTYTVSEVEINNSSLYIQFSKRYILQYNVIENLSITRGAGNDTKWAQ